LGAPNTASTMSFIRSSSVFFRSQLPDSSCSLLIELSRIEWISDVMHVDATDVDDGDITSGRIGEGGALPVVRVELVAVVALVGQSPSKDGRVGEHCGDNESRGSRARDNSYISSSV